MRTSRTLAKVLAVLVAAVCVNALLSFALVPYGSRSEVVWNQFRHTDEIDQVFVGDSLTGQCADPFAVDAVLGTKTFNMGSPSQTLQGSYLGISEAIEQHSIKRAFLGIEIFHVYDYGDPANGVFEREKGKGETLGEQLQNLATLAAPEDWLGDPQWVKLTLFPWLVNRTAPSLIWENAQLKLEGAPLEEGADLHERGILVRGRGYENFGACWSGVPIPENYVFTSEYPIEEAELLPNRLALLDDICDLCERNGVQLVVFAPPMPSFQMVDAGPRYGRLSAELTEHLAQRGVPYLDFNLAKADVYQNPLTNFVDFEHMNEGGAAEFSTSLAHVVQEMENGRPASDFLEGYDERVARERGVLASAFEQPRCTPDEARLSVKVTAAPGTVCECRFLAKGPDDEGFSVIRDYSESTQCTFAPPEHGTYEVLAELRSPETGDDTHGVGSVLVF